MDVLVWGCLAATSPLRANGNVTTQSQTFFYLQRLQTLRSIPDLMQMSSDTIKYRSRLPHPSPFHPQHMATVMVCLLPLALYTSTC